MIRGTTQIALSRRFIGRKHALCINAAYTGNAYCPGNMPLGFGPPAQKGWATLKETFPETAALARTCRQLSEAGKASCRLRHSLFGFRLFNFELAKSMLHQVLQVVKWKNAFF